MKKVIDYISEIRQSLPLDYRHIDDRMIIRLINEFRTVYIKNHYNQNKSIDRGLTQTIVVQVNPSDSSSVNYIKTGDRILKSNQIIPKIIKLSHKDLIIAIRNAKILSENYNYITKEDAVYAGNGKTNKKSIFTFIDHDGDDYLYVKLKKENPRISLLTSISIQAIFENPLDCIYLQNNKYADELQYEYPMTDTIWGYIKANILKDGLNIIQSDIADGKEKEI